MDQCLLYQWEVNQWDLLQLCKILLKKIPYIWKYCYLDQCVKASTILLEFVPLMLFVEYLYQFFVGSFSIYIQFNVHASILISVELFHILLIIFLLCQYNI